MGCLGFRGLLLTDCAFGRFYGRNNINNFTRFVVYNLFTRCIIANIKTPGINLILLDITGHGTIYISHFIIPMISGIDHQRRFGRKFPHFLAVNLIINRSIIIKHADADDIVGKVVNTDAVGVADKGAVADVIRVIWLDEGCVLCLAEHNKEEQGKDGGYHRYKNHNRNDNLFFPAVVFWQLCQRIVRKFRRA